MTDKISDPMPAQTDDGIWESIADVLIEEMDPRNLASKLKAIKQIAYGLYVKPEDVKTRLTVMLKKCEKRCIDIQTDWTEDFYNCLYIRYHRRVRRDGSIGRDITFLVHLGGSFSTF